MPTNKKKKAPTLRDLYPHATDEQIAQGEENLDGYIRICIQIADRLERARQEAELKERD